MFAQLFLLFVLVPLADIILIVMLLRTSWMVTLLITLVSGLIGAWYVRRQGTNVLQQMRQSLDRNQVPTEILIEGFLVLIAGALLITPGLITDIIGFSLLIKPCRSWYRKRFISWLKNKVQVRTYPMGQSAREADVLDATVVGRRKGQQPQTGNSDNDPACVDSKSALR